MDSLALVDLVGKLDSVGTLDLVGKLDLVGFLDLSDLLDLSDSIVLIENGELLRSPNLRIGEALYLLLGTCEVGCFIFGGLERPYFLGDMLDSLKRLLLRLLEIVRKTMHRMEARMKITKPSNRAFKLANFSKPKSSKSCLSRLLGARADISGMSSSGFGFGFGFGF